MTLLRGERLQLLRARRAELLGLIATFEHKPDSKAFIQAVRGRLSEIEQLIADVELYRA